jgi:YihY family inner membrane protein
MKLQIRTRDHLERLITDPGKELGRWARFMHFQVDLWRTCARRLSDNNVMAMSAALSFRTLLAIIPTLVLAFLVLKATGGLQSSQQQLRQFLDGLGLSTIAIRSEEAPDDNTMDGVSDEAGSPNTINLAEEIEALVSDVERQLTLKRLGPVGIALLIWSSLTLLTTMERSLNRIFGARESRALWRRVLLYWSVVTLGPLILSLTYYLGDQSTQRISMPLFQWLVKVAGWIGPGLVAILLLATLYKLMPNTHVRPHSALGGAFIAVPLWLTAKWGLTLYVTRLVGGGNLYGALGLLPLFLMWLSLSWWIFLFGAQLAHTATHLQRFQSAELARQITLGPLDLLAVALAIGRPFAKGQQAPTLDDLSAAVNLPDESVQRLIDRLKDVGVITSTSRDDGTGFVLAAAPHQIALFKLLELTGEHDASRLSRIDPDIGERVHRVRQQAATEQATLADLLD